MKRLKRLGKKFVNSLGYQLMPVDKQPSIIYSNPVTSILSGGAVPLVCVPIEKCVDKLGFTYRSTHPWVQTVMQQISIDSANVSEPASEMFYKNWRFPLIEEAFSRFVTNDKIGRHFLKVFHGGHTFLPFENLAKESVYKRIISATRYLESESESAGFHLSIDEALNDDGTWTKTMVNVELHRLWRIVCSIRANGYRPTPNPDGDIAAYALRRNGEYRFLVVSGYHRIAALAGLGFSKLRVRLHRPLVIEKSEAFAWPAVISGVYSNSQSISYFDHCFDFYD